MRKRVFHTLLKYRMAYLSMPFLFMILGYGIIFMIVSPGIEFLQAAISMVMVKEEISTDTELKTIYQPESHSRKEITFTGNGKVAETMTVPGQGEATAEEETISVSELQFPEAGTHYAMLSCARIQLEVPVYWGDTKEILQAGIGQFAGSFLPGFGRSILLSGHNTTFFKPLEQIEEGDTVICRTNYGEYRYLVREVLIQSAEEAQEELDEMLSYSEETLIMYTCFPFTPFAGKKDKRLFVYADKILGPKVE